MFLAFHFLFHPTSEEFQSTSISFLKFCVERIVSLDVCCIDPRLLLLYWSANLYHGTGHAFQILDSYTEEYIVFRDLKPWMLSVKTRLRILVINAISRLCDGYCIRTWWKAVITHHNLNKTNSSLIAWSNAWIQQLSLSHWSYPLTPSPGNPVPPWLDACLSARWQCKRVTH